MSGFEIVEGLDILLFHDVVKHIVGHLVFLPKDGVGHICNQYGRGLTSCGGMCTPAIFYGILPDIVVPYADYESASEGIAWRFHLLHIAPHTTCHFKRVVRIILLREHPAHMGCEIIMTIVIEFRKPMGIVSMVDLLTFADAVYEFEHIVGVVAPFPAFPLGAVGIADNLRVVGQSVGIFLFGHSACHKFCSEPEGIADSHSVKESGDSFF